MVKHAADNMLEAGPKQNQNVQNDAGRAICFWMIANGCFDDMDFSTGSSYSQNDDSMTGRDLTALFLMLSIARKSKKEWPDEAILNEKAEAMRVVLHRLRIWKKLWGSSMDLSKEHQVV